MAGPPEALVSSTTLTTCPPGDPGCSSQAFIDQKKGRQILMPAAWTASGYFSSTGSFRFFASEYAKNKNHSKFGAPKTLTRRLSDRLYDPNSSKVQKLELRFGTLEEKQNRQALRRSGSRRMMVGSGLDAVAQLVRLNEDIKALNSCVEESCSETEFLAIGADTAAAATETTAKTLQAGGIFIQSIDAHSRLANGLLNVSNGLILMVGGFAQIGSGGMRLYAEYEHYRESKISTGKGDFNASAAAQDGADMMYGVFQIGRAGYAFGQASRAKSLAQATSMLAIQDLTHGGKITWFLRGVGFLGVAARASVDGYSLFVKGYDENLSEEEQVRYRISGAIGLTGDAFMLMSVVLVAGPLAPLSIPLYIIGSAIHGFQWYYDHHDEMSSYEAQQEFQKQRATFQVEQERVMSAYNMSEDDYYHWNWKASLQQLFMGENYSMEESLLRAGYGVSVTREPLKEKDCDQLIPTGEALTFACVNEASEAYTYKAPPQEEVVMLVFVDPGLEGPPLSESDLGYELRIPIVLTAQDELHSVRP